MSKAVLLYPGHLVQHASDRLQLVELSSDDQVLWERFVAACPAGHLLQCWAWGEPKRTCGWNPIRLALWDAAEECLLAGAQVFLRSIPLSGASLAYIPKGPVLNWADRSLCQTFFAALHPFLHTRRVAVLCIEPDLPERIGPAAFSQRTEAGTPSSSAVVDPAPFLGGLSGPVQGSAVFKTSLGWGFVAPGIGCKSPGP